MKIKKTDIQDRLRSAIIFVEQIWWIVAAKEESKHFYLYIYTSSRTWNICKCIPKLYPWVRTKKKLKFRIYLKKKKTFNYYYIFVDKFNKTIYEFYRRKRKKIVILITFLRYYFRVCCQQVRKRFCHVYAIYL